MTTAKQEIAVLLLQWPPNQPPVSISCSLDLLLPGVVPEHHPCEFPFAAEGDPPRAVVALKAFALLLGWELKAPLGHHHRGIALALAEAAAHRFRQAVALSLGFKQAAPRLGAVGPGSVGCGQAANQAQQAQQAQSDQGGAHG